MSVTPEERIRAAAEAMDEKIQRKGPKMLSRTETLAGIALAAAYPEDFPPTQKYRWPSDETVNALRHSCDIYGDADPEAVRDALLADPIIKAAVEWRQARRDVARSSGASTLLTACGKATKALERAIDEAGL
jgi:hypothetical protein